jgi:hypothetical protein
MTSYVAAVQSSKPAPSRCSPLRPCAQIRVYSQAEEKQMLRAVLRMKASERESIAHFNDEGRRGTFMRCASSSLRSIREPFPLLLSLCATAVVVPLRHGWQYMEILPAKATRATTPSFSTTPRAPIFRAPRCGKRRSKHRGAIHVARRGAVDCQVSTFNPLRQALILFGI